MYRLINIFILSLWGFIYCPLTVSAEENIQDKDMIRMYSMEMPPYGFYDEADVAKGYIYELTAMLLSEAQFKGKNQLVPLGRMIRDLDRGTIDCVFLGSTDYVRNNYNLVEFSGKELSIGVLPNNKFQINSYDALKKLKIGVPVGAKLEQQFDGDLSLNKIEVTNYENGSLMLHRGRIDALAGVVESIEFQLSLLGEIALKGVGSPYILEKIGLYLTCKKKGVDKVKVQRLREALVKLRERGDVDRIIEKYTTTTMHAQ